MKISVCGVYCDKECHAFGVECRGCNALKGRVSWAKFLGKEVCPIYSCVINKGFSSCGECPELPCDIWLVETRNPDRTDEEYKQELACRIKNLGKKEDGRIKNPPKKLADKKGEVILEELVGSM